MKRFVMIAVVLYWLFGCGGGGGGDAPAPIPPYNGSWQFDGKLAINDCNVEDLDTWVQTFPKVTQSGNSIVIVSGRSTMSGEVHPEYDGFQATTPINTADNCQSMSGYRFEGASDGNAITRLAAVATCGKVTCSIRYDGTAVRFSTSATLTEKENSVMDTVDKAEDQVVKYCSIVGGKSVPEKAVDLETVLNETLEKQIEKKAN